MIPLISSFIGALIPGRCRKARRSDRTTSHAVYRILPQKTQTLGTFSPIAPPRHTRHPIALSSCHTRRLQRAKALLPSMHRRVTHNVLNAQRRSCRQCTAAVRLCRGQALSLQYNRFIRKMQCCDGRLFFGEMLHCSKDRACFSCLIYRFLQAKKCTQYEKAGKCKETYATQKSARERPGKSHPRALLRFYGYSHAGNIVNPNESKTAVKIISQNLIERQNHTGKSSAVCHDELKIIDNSLVLWYDLSER